MAQVVFSRPERSCAILQALDDDEMMRRYAALLARQDTARENELKAMQARTAMRAEVAGLEVTHSSWPCSSIQ